MDRQSSTLAAAKRAALVDHLRQEFAAIIRAEPCAWWHLYTTAEAIIGRHRHPACHQWLEHPANVPSSRGNWTELYADAAVSVAIAAHVRAGLPFVVDGTDLTVYEPAWGTQAVER